MIKNTSVSLALLAIYLNTWLPLDTPVIFALASPTAEDAQAILSSISASSRDRAVKDAFLAGKAKEEIDIARTLEDIIPRTTDNDDLDIYFNDEGEFDKRRLRESKRRLRTNNGFFSEDKRRLRFIKRREFGDDGALYDETGLAPRLRFHSLRKRDAF